MHDAMSHYRQIRILLYPYETHDGFAWVINYIKVQKGVPHIVQGDSGIVDDPERHVQWEKFERAVRQAADAAY